VPRPDKRIVPGPDLNAPTAASRANSWTKYGGHETIDGRGAPSQVEVTVDDITVVGPAVDEEVSKWDLRGTSAHLPEVEETEPTRTVTEIRKEWNVDRRIEGRTYRRTDTAMFVEVEVDV
jgi:hypothetical protein